MDIFIIGKGASRDQYNFEKLKERGPVYGCNNLHKQFVPNVLFCNDRAELKNLVNIKYASKHSLVVPDKVLPNGYFKNFKYKQIEGTTIPNYVNVEAIALHYAYLQKPNKIFLVGVDCSTHAEELSSIRTVLRKFEGKGIKCINVNADKNARTTRIKHNNYKTIDPSHLHQYVENAVLEKKIDEGETPEVLHDRVFIFGNGPSRKEFDPYRLKPFGEIWGCNAMYKDYEMDKLFCVDTQISQEIRGSKYIEKNVLVLNKRTLKVDDHANLIKAEYGRVNTAGGAAMQYAAKDYGVRNVYLLGIDNAPGNVYEDTHPIYIRQKNRKLNWSSVGKYYLDWTITKYPSVNFINVYREKNGLQFNIENFSAITYEEFEKLIATNFNGDVAE